MKKLKVGQTLYRSVYHYDTGYLYPVPVTIEKVTRQYFTTTPTEDLPANNRGLVSVMASDDEYTAKVRYFISIRAYEQYTEKRALYVTIRNSFYSTAKDIPFTLEQLRKINNIINPVNDHKDDPQEDES